MSFDTFFEDLIRETQKAANPKIVENEKKAIRFSSFVETKVLSVARAEIDSDELAARLLEAVNLYRELTFNHTGIPKNASFISTVSILAATFQNIEEETNVDVRRLVNLEDYLDAAQSILGDQEATASYFAWQRKSMPKRSIA
jgi:hypothetical protein